MGPVIHHDLNITELSIMIKSWAECVIHHDLIMGRVVLHDLIMGRVIHHDLIMDRVINHDLIMDRVIHYDLIMDRVCRVIHHDRGWPRHGG